MGGAKTRISESGYSHRPTQHDETQPPSFHYELGKGLAALREEALIIGSGNYRS